MLKELMMFASLVIDGQNYGAVVTASEVYPDGVAGVSAPVYFLYTEPGQRCTGIPRHTGRESILRLNGQSIPVVSVDYDPTRNVWEFQTVSGSVSC